MLEQIIEAQTKYGKEFINNITTRGSIDARDDLETALTKFIAAETNPGWAFNNIPNLFGVNMDKGGYNEAKSIMANDFAKAAISGSGNIRIGEKTVTYQEFLDMEKIMNDTFRGLSSILAAGNSDINTAYKNPLYSKTLDTIQKWLAGQKNSDIRDLVASWLNDVLKDFNHIYAMRTKAEADKDVTAAHRWRHPQGAAMANIKAQTQGFDISKVNAIYVSFQDMLI